MPGPKTRPLFRKDSRSPEARLTAGGAREVSWETGLKRGAYHRGWTNKQPMSKRQGWEGARGKDVFLGRREGPTEPERSQSQDLDGKAPEGASKARPEPRNGARLCQRRRPELERAASVQGLTPRSGSFDLQTTVAFLQGCCVPHSSTA